MAVQAAEEPATRAYLGAAALCLIALGLGWALMFRLVLSRIAPIRALCGLPPLPKKD